MANTKPTLNSPGECQRRRPGQAQSRKQGKSRAENKVKPRADKAKPETELWLLWQPDMSPLDIGAMIEPKLIVITANSQLYK
jgi:hypothetical protein